MKTIEKIVIGILIGVITYFYLIPPIHELGHYFYAIMNHWTVLEVHISLPSLLGNSYVIVLVPPETNLTFFLMAGSFSTLIVGFIISILPILIKNQYIFLPVGYALMLDSILYPILDLTIFKSGDFYQLGLIPSLLTIAFSIVFFIISFTFNQFLHFKK